MGYLVNTISGLTWTGGYRGATRIIAFIKIAVLARILVPEQFGLFGIAALVLAFLEILTETGINIFFIQGEGKLKDYLNTAWVVSIIRGILISIIILVAAPFIASFFQSPLSLNLLLLISIVPLIKGFINPSVVVFQKELKFDREFYFRFTIFTFDAVIAILFAIITGLATSLVWGLIAGAMVEVTLSFLFINPKPKFEFDFKKVKKVVDRGKWVTGYGLLNYLFENGDDVVVGRVLNTYSLGLYQNAYKISTLPITEISASFAKVTFPVYSKIAGDATRIKRAFSKVLASITLLALPIGIFIYLFAAEIILIVLGPNWLEATIALKILAVYGVIKAILSAPHVIFLALKKQEYVSAAHLASTVGLLVTVIPLTKSYGIEGAAFATIIGITISIPVTVYYTIKIFNNN